MSDHSTIEWTDATWGPTLGCTRVSAGCDNCYAIRTATIRAGNPNPKVAAAFAGLAERRDGRLDWTGRVNLLPDRLDQPLRWRKPRLIFVDSQSDLFHDQVPDEFIARVFGVMAATPQHTYQLLTKRHGRMRALLNNGAWRSSVFQHESLTGAAERRDLPAWPLANVWLGVSVEDQKRADLRIPALLDTPAAVRWISAEPLLGPVDLYGPVDQYGGRPRQTYWLTGRPTWGEPHTNEPYKAITQPLTVGPRIDWVVAGGESGPGARPAHPAWFRQLRDQCQGCDVPFFFKQWGDWGPAPWSVRVCDPAVGWTGTDAELAEAKRDAEARGATHCVQSHGHLYEPPHKTWSLERVGDQDGAVRRWGKKAAGRELDGQLHDAMPERAQ